jgi:hypothetical protein
MIAISIDYNDEVEFNVVLLDVCGLILGNPYIWDQDAQIGTLHVYVWS